MIKTVPFDIPLSFLVGMLVALACSQGIRSAQSLVDNRYFLGVLLWELFFMVPLGTYLYFFYPDWSLMFFVDPGTMAESTRRIVGISAVSCYLASGLAGFVLCAWLIRSDRDNVARIVFLGLAAAILIFSIITMKQLTHVGTYSDWTALPQTTVPLITHRIGYVVGIDAAAATVFLFLMIRSFRQKTADVAG